MIQEGPVHLHLLVGVGHGEIIQTHQLNSLLHQTGMTVPVFSAKSRKPSSPVPGTGTLTISALLRLMAWEARILPTISKMRSVCLYLHSISSAT